MKDEKFLQCWSLSNLRPLSAKINSALGVSLAKKKNKKHDKTNRKFIA